ncbi:hypothetical protein [Pseudomonas paralcaligenes]|uniref:hypothetical protein n=1 Tax=Pseudomonas paralcaligenes TaxID=2772558 RepID=UPI0021D2538C|nr:hypothetical protein [Pseudomonas paralcaligenes]
MPIETGCTHCGSDQHNTTECPMREAIARPVHPSAPETWRAFIADCAATAGGMVNGNRLSARAAELLAASPAPEVRRCETCDGTGDVHRADGEYLGECHCTKATQPAAQQGVGERT